jgi:sugar phosphate isomerase/epimerase
MRIGVYSDSLPKLSRRALFAWCAERGVTDIELGVGTWGPWPRPHLDLALIGSAAERDRLVGELREHGMRLAAVNAAGNLLHPDAGKRAEAQTRFKAAVELAVALGVKRVITMSGCPAGPGGGSLSVFPCWATSSDDERIFDWQMEHAVGPYWRETSAWLAKAAPGVMVCLELHPGVTIFSADGFAALDRYVGRNIGLNMDPSHFWWQGIDPVTVIEAFGDRIGYAHGKDTLLYPDRIRRQGVLHFAPPADPAKAPWHFAAVGEGHDDATWTALIRALRRAGYDDVISIEHEDPRYDGEEGAARSLAGLTRAIKPIGAAP